MTISRDDALLIGLDWGTSSLRAYLLAQSGRVLEDLSLDLGIMRLQPTSAAVNREEAFEAAFSQACARWLTTMPSLPIIASGMVGSAQGWREASYLEVPFDLRTLGKNLSEFQTGTGSTIHIVPGLIRRAGLTNVMRGEETQILGAMAGHHTANFPEKTLIGMPGTHSKWVSVEGTTVENFETFMTGEVFAALCNHTILGRTMRHTPVMTVQAFDRGVETARQILGELGVLSNIFSVRALGLTGDLAPEEQPDYLSGLLIGHEIRALSTMQARTAQVAMQSREPTLLIGDPSLCARYERALGLYGYEDVRIADQGAARGLYQVALEAGLITTSNGKVAKENNLC